ncbi:MAG: phage integrase N-terminal SAM-like domain-containing protein [Deltaproteobacteria bacterium]|nr:phage integrase N-terminal SAM-like domain-containing protein [Deltaproteobacteria bacterium]
MMTDWYERTIKALQLNGKEERTQQLYARAVRMLSEFYEKTPDLVSEEELQEYFLYRKNVNKWAPNTMRICYEKCGKMWDVVD